MESEKKEINGIGKNMKAVRFALGVLLLLSGVVTNYIEPAIFGMLVMVHSL